MTKNHQNQLSFIRNVQKNLSKITESILNHPYLYALEKNEIAKEKLEIFVYEQYYIISNDKRNFALMISRASEDTAAKLLTTCLNTELNALENLTLMAEELGIEKRKIYEYETSAGCQSYTNYLTKLAVYGSDVEILAALLIDFPVWGSNCSKMSSALKKNYGFTVNSCLFLDKFASPLQEEFVNESSKLIDSALPKYEKEMFTAARLILDYELSFWDTIYKYSIISK
jgi:thiaminase